MEKRNIVTFMHRFERNRDMYYPACSWSRLMCELAGKDFFTKFQMDKFKPYKQIKVLLVSG